MNRILALVFTGLVAATAAHAADAPKAAAAPAPVAPAPAPAAAPMAAPEGKAAAAPNEPIKPKKHHKRRHKPATKPDAGAAGDKGDAAAPKTAEAKMAPAPDAKR
jgi:hypothetical protein